MTTALSLAPSALADAPSLLPAFPDASLNAPAAPALPLDTPPPGAVSPPFVPAVPADTWATRRRAARLADRLFRWGMGALVFSSATAVVYRLVWMGQ